MAVLTVHTRDGKQVQVAVSPVVSILNTLLRNEIPVHHACGGHAQCGTCRVRIVKGAERLSPIHDDERRRLAAAGAPPDFRLACQTFAFGDVTIQIPSEAS
ncbi:MAG: (2Fe-2S)-binding protein [Spirochaetales bacterium]|nr:(2Fe-2S)-binding protein [Spirochaetales bacterium]